MSTPDPPQLQPVRNDGIRAMQVGLGLWAVAGLILLLRRDELADQGTLWWLAVCGAALLIGIVTLGIFVKRRSLIRAREHDESPTSTGPTDSRSTGAGPTG
jgi:ABC-type nickel/cobalt efflux system permease component RcnA